MVVGTLVFYGQLSLTDTVISIGGFTTPAGTLVSDVPAILDNFFLDDTGTYLQTIEATPGTIIITTNTGDYTGSIAASDSWWNTIVLSSHPVHAPN